MSLETTDLNALVLNPKFPWTRLQKVSGILAEHHPVRVGFSRGPEKIYDVRLYLIEDAVYGNTGRMLLDRNIVSRLIEAASGAELSEHHRLAAAVLGFAQCAKVEIEPNIASYELATSVPEKEAHRQVRTLRSLDNLDPAIWLDVALGRPFPADFRVDNIEYDSSTRLPIDLKMPLRLWRRNYIIALKIAEFELSPMKAVECVEALLEWMHRDFLFKASATIFAFNYFSPRAPRSGLLKGLRAKDRMKAISGIKNAAWDLTLISQWADMLAESSLRLLASFDRWVLRLAQSVVVVGDESPDEMLERNLLALWPEPDAGRLRDLYRSLSERLESTERATLRGSLPIDELINDGERRILGAKPK